jgi:superfamily II DNA helicase RecQ
LKSRLLSTTIKEEDPESKFNMLPRVKSKQPAPISNRLWSATGVNVYKKVFEMSDENLKAHIAHVAYKKYGQTAKAQQIEAVANLVSGRNTFVLAGTGFGKSRIAEIYFSMLPMTRNSVILTLNPLDSLGDNQVFEKRAAGFSAINLNKLNFNKKVADDISKGVYQFVYLSPEIFLNNKLWEEVYFSSEFQNRLGLVVVDEAHMVYIWGLVQSRPGRHLATILSRLEDFGIFRPSYGHLGGHLLSRNDKPMLLLSATCRPVAVEAIKKSLKLEDSNVDIIRAELTRPKIRIVRIPMEGSMVSCHDLIKVFPSVNDVSNEDLVPTLVYSGSRNRTLTALEVISMARETPADSMNPSSTCALRYHSCTGDLDKNDCVEDFATGKVPIVSCTMALGLGQNWKRVRMVVHMGRGDPASVVQMIGRCGRDGRPGLAILFVEKNRRNGKNSVDEFHNDAIQSDDDRMDALAVTPVCLRVAFSIDNLYVYLVVLPDSQMVMIDNVIIFPFLQARLHTSSGE